MVSDIQLKEQELFNLRNLFQQKDQEVLELRNQMNNIRSYGSSPLMQSPSFAPILTKSHSYHGGEHIVPKKEEDPIPQFKVNQEVFNTLAQQIDDAMKTVAQLNDEHLIALLGFIEKSKAQAESLLQDLLRFKNAMIDEGTINLEINNVKQRIEGYRPQVEDIINTRKAPSLVQAPIIETKPLLLPKASKPFITKPPEEVKIETREVSPSVGMQTRSQGPAIIGHDITHEIVDEKGEIVYKGEMFELAGKMYSTPEYVLNIIKPSKTSEIKVFKQAFLLRQREKDDRFAIDDTKYYAKAAIKILEEVLKKDKVKVALVMHHMINKHPDVLSDFKNKFTREYSQYLPGPKNVS